MNDENSFIEVQAAASIPRGRAFHSLQLLLKAMRLPTLPPRTQHCIRYEINQLTLLFTSLRLGADVCAHRTLRVLTTMMLVSMHCYTDELSAIHSF